MVTVEVPPVKVPLFVQLPVFVIAEAFATRILDALIVRFFTVSA